MNILLDTCAFIWAVSAPDKLTSDAATALTEREALIYVSPISCAEIAFLAERGRIILEQHWKTWFNHFLRLNDWHVKDIDLPVIQEAYSLPGSFHQDPADRIITATARLYNLTVVTADRKIIDYPHVATLW
jgi:PIN domain nuclease of toxin-antitoxin system